MDGKSTVSSNDIEGLIKELPLTYGLQTCKKPKLVGNSCYWFVGKMPTDEMPYELAWWFIQREYRAKLIQKPSIFAGNLHVSPLTRQACVELFHATPLRNLPGIKQQGLMAAHLLGSHTTRWAHSSECIHGSIEREKASQWVANDKLLASHCNDQDWAIIRLSVPHDCPIYPDSFSREGSIFGWDRLPPECYVDHEIISRRPVTS